MGKDIQASRRKFLKTAALGAAAAVVGGGLRTPARAQTPDKVDPSDPLAQALHYVADASKAPKRAAHRRNALLRQLSVLPRRQERRNRALPDPDRQARAGQGLVHVLGDEGHRLSETAGRR